jgi:hypothetical protein
MYWWVPLSGWTLTRSWTYRNGKFIISWPSLGLVLWTCGKKEKACERTFFEHHGERMPYKYPWDEKSTLTSVVRMRKAAICFSRSWVGAAEVGAWCRKHIYQFCQANPNWACRFELGIHKPQIRSKSSLTKVTGTHFSKDAIKHYILTISLLRCSTIGRNLDSDSDSDSDLLKNCSNPGLLVPK